MINTRDNISSGWRLGLRLPPKNKKLAYYMSLPYEIRVAPPSEVDGDWFAEIPLLDGCMTQAPKDMLLDYIEDAKESWLELSLELGDEIPEPVPVKL